MCMIVTGKAFSPIGYPISTNTYYRLVDDIVITSFIKTPSLHTRLLQLTRIAVTEHRYYSVVPYHLEDNV